MQFLSTIFQQGAQGAARGALSQGAQGTAAGTGAQAASNSGFNFGDLIKTKVGEAADKGSTKLQLKDFGIGGFLGNLGGDVPMSSAHAPTQPPLGQGMLFQDLFKF